MARRSFSQTLVEPLESRIFCSATLLVRAGRRDFARPGEARRALRGALIEASLAVGARSAMAAPMVSTALTPPQASLVRADAESIVLASSAPVGGTGIYTYQWHRGTSAGFLPDASNTLPGATALTWSDSDGLISGVPYFYVLEASDGTSSVFSNQVMAGLARPTSPADLVYQSGPLVLGYLGSSTWAISTASGQVPTMITQSLQASYPGSITTINSSVVGTTTSNYLPGQPNSNALKSALQAASGYKVLRLMIGSNDAALGVPVSQWLSNMQAIINDALSWPVDKIILEEIGIRLDRGQAALDLIRQYNAARSRLAGPQVVLGTAFTYENQADHLNTLATDQVHQTDAGQVELAANQALELARLVTSDKTLPNFYGVKVSALTSTSVQLDWTSDKPCDSRVEFGTSGTLDAVAVSSDAALSFDHHVVLTGLPPGDAFVFRLSGADAWGHIGSTLICSTPLPAIFSPIIGDASFESAPVTGYAYRPAGSSWNFIGNAGIQANGSVWSAPAAPDGSQTAFLQSSFGDPATSGRIEQTFAAPVDATYDLSFKGALRVYRAGTTTPQQIALYLDGSLIKIFSPLSTTRWSDFSIAIPLTAGTHILSFRAAQIGGDTSAFIDKIVFALPLPAQSVVRPRLALRPAIPPETLA